MLKKFLLASMLSLSIQSAQAVDKVHEMAAQAAPLPACQCAVDIEYVLAKTWRERLRGAPSDVIVLKQKALHQGQGCYELKCGEYNRGQTFGVGSEVPLVSQLLAGDPLTLEVFSSRPDWVQSEIKRFPIAPPAPTCQTRLSDDGKQLFVGRATVKILSPNECGGISASK